MANDKIYVIGIEEIVILLGLLGIEGSILTEEREFVKLFDKITSNSSIGMLIIACKLSKDNFQKVTDFKINRRKPFIFHLPDFPIEGIKEKLYFEEIFKTIRKITS